MKSISSFKKHPVFRPVAILALIVCMGLIASMLDFIATKKSNVHKPSVRLEKTFKSQSSPGIVAWSPDGTLLAISYALSQEIVIWHYADMKVRATIQTEGVVGSSLEFTADGRFLVIAAARKDIGRTKTALSLIDVNSGELKLDVDGPVVNATDSRINIARKFALSKSTQQAAIVTDDGKCNYITFYDTVSWKMIATTLPIDTEHNRCTRFVSDIKYNPISGKLAVLDFGGNLEIWDTDPNLVPKIFPIYKTQGTVTAAFSADGRFLFSAPGDGYGAMYPDPSAVLKLETISWSITSGPLSTVGNDFRARAITVSPAGRYFASIHYDGAVRLWDTDSLKPLTLLDKHGDGGVAIAFSPDGSRLAIARDFEVRVLKLDPN